MAVAPVFRDDASAAFFDGTARGELLIRHCVPNGHALAPDQTQCPRCGSTELEWVGASGRAQLVSWAVVHTRPANPGDAEQTDVLGLVELEEGPWMHAALIPGDSADRQRNLRIGQDLIVDFVESGEGETLPAFRPA